MKKVLVKIFVHWKQKVQVNLFWSCNFHSLTSKILTVTILIHVMNQKSWLHSIRLIFMKITACPFIYCHNFLSFMMDIVNRSARWFSMSKIESSEHWSCTQIGLVNKLILKFMKWKFWLSDNVCLSITNKNILNNFQIRIFVLLSCFIRIANKHKAIFLSLPHCCHCDLKILYTILQSHLLL